MASAAFAAALIRRGATALVPALRAPTCPAVRSGRTTFRSAAAARTTPRRPFAGSAPLGSSSSSSLDIDEEVDKILQGVVEERPSPKQEMGDFFAEMDREFDNRPPARGGDRNSFERRGNDSRGGRGNDRRGGRGNERSEGAGGGDWGGERDSGADRDAKFTKKVGAGRYTPDEEDAALDFGSMEVRNTSNPRYTEKMGIPKSIIDSLSARGITAFTPVQAEAFTPVLAGHDVIGRSRTGTGKTLAFGVPAITRLLRDRAPVEGGDDRRARGGRQPRRKPGILILCPTRELARQVSDELREVTKGIGATVDVFYGGVSMDSQVRSLRKGLDVVVGTPGRIIDHLNRGNLDLSELRTAVLDEADEMLNMGFAEDVEEILRGMGSVLDIKTQVLLFSATTPSWVKDIARNYQSDAFNIDATSKDAGARTATTVRHLAVQVPPGKGAKHSLLEDIIAVEISKDSAGAVAARADALSAAGDNVVALEAIEAHQASNAALQQRIFGKTIVFTQTKRDADELVSGGVFKSLTAQALHGDVGQKQRDSTLNAFRAGSFNVLVATDVAARGIDIRDVDLVVQYEPPRDVDTYVHRSGRTGRAGRAGTSVLLFEARQQRDVVRIERSLGHGFQFELAGPPTAAAALGAAARTSALACTGVDEVTAGYFTEAAKELLASGMETEEVVARCLAAISKRSARAEHRSLLTGEAGYCTVQMESARGKTITPGDVMFAVNKLSRMSRESEESDEESDSEESDSEDDSSEKSLAFEADVGKIQLNQESGTACFDMSDDDAVNLVAFAKNINTGSNFVILEDLRSNVAGRSAVEEEAAAAEDASGAPGSVRQEH
eukprot:CAMPEP_0194270286 /NCGR_PEP_ID=MMETSP0169-20130528/4297_1 /TAXON_ID=218684 /ORGANISM="Corethron pennatum, Strain L29A3" /LENGTH=837 /DNA_ID=CAMNT_0039012281 /DNA_START=224 /DNA_END=2735 /DNA_ORIENTATION=+